MLRRRQLPARSPFRISNLPAAAHDALIGTGDPRAVLAAGLVAQYAGAGAILTASATHALSRALVHAVREKPGASILLPAYTCFEVATAAVACGARVLLYDLDDQTLGPDWESVRRATRGRDVAAIVVSPLFGLPIEWDNARRAADDANAPLVADVAQAHGSMWRDRPAGAIGDLIVLSFGRGKGWTGFGGGALLWTSANDGSGLDAEPITATAPASEVKTLLSAAFQWIFSRPSLFGIPAAVPALHIGETIYHEPTPVRAMTRMSAALVLRSAPDATAEAAARRRNALEYARSLPQAMVPAWCESATSPESGALRFPILVRGGWSALRAGPAPYHGAAPGYPTSIAEIAALRTLLDVDPIRTPVAERLAAMLITLPTHSTTTPADRARLVELIGSLAPPPARRAPAIP